MSCCWWVSVRVFVPELRSWLGNNNSCIYLSSKCYSAFWQESPLGTTVTLWGPDSGWTADLSWWLPQDQVPDPAQLSSLRKMGTQDPTGPWAPQATHTAGTGQANCTLYRWLLPEVAETGMGARFTAASRLGPSQLAELARALEPQRTQTPACSLGPWLNCWPGPGKLESPGRRWGSASYLTLLDDHHSAHHWLNGPIMLAHWQSLTWGRGPLQCWPMAEGLLAVSGKGLPVPTCWDTRRVGCSSCHMLRALLHDHLHIVPLTWRENRGPQPAVNAQGNKSSGGMWQPKTLLRSQPGGKPGEAFALSGELHSGVLTWAGGGAASGESWGSERHNGLADHGA